MNASILYGGDYNPEQWPAEVWDEDVALMQRGNVNIATVGVFAWARLEPRPGQYDFTWLDDVLDRLHAAGVRVDLATATASPPPWLAKSYPETLPVTEGGIRLAIGSRQHYCPSSPIYRAHAKRLVERLVARYRHHPAVEMWHVNNEYGCHVSRCYCEVSAEAFRAWLRRRYGSVDRLNQAWATAFWSQQYHSFGEVEPPRTSPTFKNPTQLLDFDRFSSDELLSCFRAEAEIIRAGSDKAVTTNFMGFFKPVDYWKWAREVDIVSDDTYPDPADPASPAQAAMARDLMRSLGGGAPWLLMEQSPGAVNWRAHNASKAPGQMRALSYQAVARGADGVLFFQWRQSKAGSEKFHSGMVPHGGVDTRVWREVEQLGGELARLSSPDVGIVGARLSADVAIVIDWDSWWAIEQPASPTTLSYLEVIEAWHRSFSSFDLVVDFVRPQAQLNGYRIVVAPALFAVDDAAIDNLVSYAESGGRLVVGFATGVTDENLHIRLGGYLGGRPLRRALGIRVEEFAPPVATTRARRGAVALRGEGLEGDARGTVWAEYIHVDDAMVIAHFASGALDGHAAVTRRTTEHGAAWYVATLPDDRALRELVRQIAYESGIARIPPAATGSSVECVQRGGLLFIINHGSEHAELIVDGRELLTGSEARGVRLPPHGVAIVQPVESRNG